MVVLDNTPPRALTTALGEAWLPVLALTGDGSLPVPPDLAPRLEGNLTVVPIGSPRPDVEHRTLLLVVDDVAGLRAAVSRLGEPWGARVVVAVVGASDAALTLRPQPAWGGIARIEASVVDGAAVTVVELVRRGPAAAVLAALAQAAVPMRAAGPEGLRLATRDVAVPSADVSVVRSYDPAAKVPPSVVVGADPAPLTESAVLGRAPARVDAPALAPLDEGVLNPRGFPRTPSGPPLDLDPGARLTVDLARRMRSAPHVRVTWPSSLEVVAGLAMSGAVLVSGPAPPQARDALGVGVAAVLESPVPAADDPDHDLRREERSVRLRRAALAAHSGAGWRERLRAGVAGRPDPSDRSDRSGWPDLRIARHPTVSILLATRRPEQLAFALGQVARLRPTLPGADVQLVLATHGFSPDRGLVADLLGGPSGGVPHHVVEVPPEAVLGEVLRAATDAASGDVVLKMDDDDWYSPDVVTDLLLARRHSGADLVGMPAEMVRLESSDLTIRRRGPSENHGSFVAGGTLLLDRTLLRGLGGFRPVPTHEDARLLHAVQVAGGTIYRSHGLGYLLRRRAVGHTWDPGDAYFLRPGTVTAQWPGLRPSALLEVS